MSAITPEAKRDLILSVGMHQKARPLSPIGVAELLDRMIASGITRREVSAEIMIDPTLISRFLRLLKLAPEIQHLVGWQGESEVSFSTAAEIARVDRPEEHSFLVKGVLEHRLSKQEVAQIVESRIKFGRPIDQCTEETLRMRPRTVRRYLFIGAVNSADVQDRLGILSADKRDELLGEAIASSCPHLPPWEGKLGTKGFSLIGDEALNQALSDMPTDLESAINEYLRGSILGDDRSAS